MEKVRQWLWRWLMIPDAFADERILGITTSSEFPNQGRFLIPDARLVTKLEDEIKELRGRIEDLEAAYPDYNKAKEQAEENKSKEIVPGFRPFTQRKRAWEAQHRKPAEKK